MTSNHIACIFVSVNYLRRSKTEHEHITTVTISMFELLTQPWPWYIAGPVIGLTVPIVLLIGGKMFGFSSNFRHFVSACGVSKNEFFNYNWRKDGAWNIIFLVGAVLGGFLGGYVFANPNPIALNPVTVEALSNMGIQDFSGFVPTDIFTWSALGTPVRTAGADCRRILRWFRSPLRPAAVPRVMLFRVFLTCRSDLWWPLSVSLSADSSWHT